MPVKVEEKSGTSKTNGQFVRIFPITPRFWDGCFVAVSVNGKNYCRYDDYAAANRDFNDLLR